MKQLRRRISYIALGLFPAALGAWLFNSFGLGAEFPYAPIAAGVGAAGMALTAVLKFPVSGARYIVCCVLLSPALLLALFTVPFFGLFVSLGTADAESLLKACMVFGIFVVSPVFCAVHFLLFSRDALNNSPESAPLRVQGDGC